MREYLKALRAEKSLSQENIAKKLGISQNYYSMIESGERQPKMTIDTAQKLADIFGVPISYILEHENKTA